MLTSHPDPFTGNLSGAEELNGLEKAEFPCLERVLCRLD